MSIDYDRSNHGEIRFTTLNRECVNEHPTFLPMNDMAMLRIQGCLTKEGGERLPSAPAKMEEVGCGGRGGRRRRRRWAPIRIASEG